jgi:uncharacterized protein YggE
MPETKKETQMSKKNLFNISFLAGILLIAVVLVGCSGVAQAQGVTPTPRADSAPSAQTMPRTIAVTGSGSAFLDPDLALVTIGVQTEAEEAAEAVADNNAQSQELIDALRDFGIAANDIQTTNFSIFPQQQIDPQGRTTGEIQYVVNNSVQVTVRDLDQVGDLLDAAVQAGANSIYGIQYDVEDKTEALAGARQEAVANARELAEELAQAAGVSVGEVQSISIGGAGYPTPMPLFRGGDMAQAEAAVPVNPGQMHLTVDVTVVYTIE